GIIDGVRLAGLLVVACSIGFAQYPGGYPGGYPPGGYPPGYPRTPGVGIPIPSKGSNKPSANAPMPSFRGNLRQMDDKTITLETEDHRELQFKRNSRTKFIKNGDEIKSPQFEMGDQLSIEGPEDAQGY